ncbi:MAG: hypothetical protein LBE12_05900 [Planctomycetaceae bacterium]|jgi:hypothetical protein|nr:hypothetical protein [Planctomycetaceae bacterium]
MNENIYTELELFLDPPIIHPEELKNELENKLIPEWNKKVNASPKFKALTETARKYLQRDLATLGLANLSNTAWKEKLDELIRHITEYERDGILEESEYKALKTKFSPFFKEKTIESKLHFPVTPDFQPPAKPASLNDEAMSISEMDAMTADLKLIADGSYSNLYELLSMSRTSTTKALLETAKEINEKNRRVPQKTSEVDAKNRVLGKAITIFKDDTFRKKYDIALKRRPFDKLCREYFDLRATGKTVSNEDYELSVKDAQQNCGYSQAEAEWLVYDYYINQRKCSPPRHKADIKPTLQCPACFHLNDVSFNLCSECGTPLKIECPQCRKESLFSTGYCQCGFALGDRANAIMATKEAKKALSENKIDEAKSWVRKSLIYWKDNADALALRSQIDVIEKQETERKRKEQAELEQKRKQAAVLENKIRELTAKKYLFEAEKVVTELKEVYPESAILQNEGKQVAATLSTVRSDLAKLPNIKTTQEKLDLCESIIERVNDCYEAKQALEKFPPLPPSNLQVKELPNSFQLSWTPPQARRVPHFILVRKTGGIPVSASDGEQIAKDLDGTTYTDSTCSIGVIYGYAVFSRRGEQIETTGTQSKLLQLIGDVQNLQTQPNDSTVTLTWTPLSAGSVKIIRSSEGIADKEIFSQKPGYLQDSNLKNGQIYTYKVQVIFKNPEGKEIITPGKTVSCKPVLPPSAVLDLKADIQPNDEVLLHWTPPKKGHVYIFVVKEKNLPVAGFIQQTGLDGLIKIYGKPIENTETNSANWQNTETGYISLLPVTVENGLAVFGNSVSVHKIEEVKNLRLYNSGTHWHLRWDWANNVDKVLIVYRNDQPPKGKNDNVAVRKVLSKKEYDVEDAFSLSANQDYYFAVYVLLEKDGKFTASKGIHRQTHKTIIKYSLSFRRGSSGEIEGVVEITAENAESLPACIVKRAEDRPPLTRHEGAQIASSAESQRKRSGVLLPKKYFAEDCFIRVFIKDVQQSGLYRIIDPPQRELELYPR